MPGRVVTLKRFSGQSDAGEAVTVSTTTGLKMRLSHVLVAYSGSPTHSGVTVTLNSGLGAAYDALMHTGSSNARYTSYVPSTELLIAEDDQIDVLAPDGGGSLVSSVAIYCEVLA